MSVLDVVATVEIREQTEIVFVPKFCHRNVESHVTNFGILFVKKCLQVQEFITVFQDFLLNIFHIFNRTLLVKNVKTTEWISYEAVKFFIFY